MEDQGKHGYIPIMCAFKVRDCCVALEVDDETWNWSETRGYVYMYKSIVFVGPKNPTRICAWSARTCARRIFRRKGFLMTYPFLLYHSRSQTALIIRYIYIYLYEQMLFEEFVAESVRVAAAYIYLTPSHTSSYTATTARQCYNHYKPCGWCGDYYIMRFLTSYR